MTDPTVAGPEAAPLTQEDIAHFERRKFVQRIWDLHVGNSTWLMYAMAENKVSAAEMHDCNDYRVDTNQFLRSIPAPDGFQGLKVYSTEQLQRFYSWKAKQYNPLGGGTFAEYWQKTGYDPMSDMQDRARTMELFDREYSRAKIRGIPPEWEL